MKIEVKVKEVGTKEDHYDVSIKTYKEKIVGVFERSELRYLIEVLDNAINVGWKEEYINYNTEDNNGNNTTKEK